MFLVLNKCKRFEIQSALFGRAVHTTIATGRLIVSTVLVRIATRAAGGKVANYNLTELAISATLYYIRSAIYSLVRDRDIPPSLKSFFFQQ